MSVQPSIEEDATNLSSMQSSHARPSDRRSHPIIRLRNDLHARGVFAVDGQVALIGRLVTAGAISSMRSYGPPTTIYADHPRRDCVTVSVPHHAVFNAAVYIHERGVVIRG